MKKTFILTVSILCILLLAIGVSAEHKFSTDAEAEEHQIASNEIVIYDLAITNNQEMSDKLILEAGTTEWDITITPYVIDISSGETKHVSVRIAPPRGISLGSYTIEIIIRSLEHEGTRTYKFLPVVIDKIIREKGETLIELDHNFPEKIDSNAERVNISFSLKNVIKYPINKLELVIESNLLESPYDIYIPKLGAGDIQIYTDVSLKLANVSTGPYIINFTMLEGDQVLYEEEHPTYLGSYGIVEEKTCTGSLVKTCLVTVRNEKLFTDNGTHSIEIDGMARHVVVFRPTPNTIEKADGKKIASWEYSLVPGEEDVYKYTVWYLFYIIAIILAVVISVFGTYSYSLDFKIAKNVIAPPGSRSMKVQLAIRNKRRTTRHNVVVEDFIPSPLVLVKEFGTIDPTVIKQEQGRVKVVWKFSELGPGEERLMSYRMRSTVGIVGRMTLPLATVKCRVKDKLKKFYSNETKIIGKPGVKEQE